MAPDVLTSDDLIQRLKPDLAQYSQQMHAAVRQQDHEAFVRAYEDFCTVADGIGQAMSVGGSELFPFQADGVAFLAANERGLLVVHQGLGKTAQAPSIETESAPCAMHSGPIDVAVFSGPRPAPSLDEQALARLRRLPMYHERPGDNG